jgi:NADH-quinone oxidoreductase subunit J
LRSEPGRPLGGATWRRESAVRADGTSALMGAALLAATIPDVTTFVIAGVITLAGAFGVIAMRNPVHCALMLIMTLFGVAVLFVEEDAQFLAAVQVIVYAGAIVVLFLFVIMLLGVDRRERLLAETFRGQRLIVVVLGMFVLFEVIYLARDHWTTGAHSVQGAIRGSGVTGASGATGNSNTAELGRAIFTTYLLPFEVTSALLVVAVVGAVVLARRPQRLPGTEGGDPASQIIPSDQPLGAPTGVAPAEPPPATGPSGAGPSATASDEGGGSGDEELVPAGERSGEGGAS